MTYDIETLRKKRKEISEMLAYWESDLDTLKKLGLDARAAEVAIVLKALEVELALTEKEIREYE
jgi:hypothetical protein